jgi:hypothetical protein
MDLDAYRQVKKPRMSIHQLDRTFRTHRTFRTLSAVSGKPCLPDISDGQDISLRRCPSCPMSVRAAYGPCVPRKKRAPSCTDAEAEPDILSAPVDVQSVDLTHLPPGSGGQAYADPNKVDTGHAANAPTA